MGYDFILREIDSYSKEDAIIVMVNIRRELLGDKSISSSSTRGRSSDPSKNPTISKIAGDVIGGGRRRFVERHIKKICENVGTKSIKPRLSSQEKEMSEMKAIMGVAYNLMCSRNKKYGDSRKVLSIQSIANLVEMKLHRIANLDKLDPKIEDELLDAINYCTFALHKLKDF